MAAAKTDGGITIMSDIFIRPVTPDDASALLDIYRYYVEHTAISFETVTPTEEEFRRRLRDVLEKYPCFAAVRQNDSFFFTCNI